MQSSAPNGQDILLFGVSGDLAKRKLLPALYNLSADHLLPFRGRIIGTSRVPAGLTDPTVLHDDATLRQLAESAVREFSRTPFDQGTFDEFAQRLTFFDTRANELRRVRTSCTTDRILAYLAVPSAAFPGLVTSLEGSGLAGDTSVVIEKPFGHDLRSAQELDAMLHGVFPEDRVYRIDHYLGKETVQNILIFRFHNTLFESAWNCRAVDRFEITMAESIGVEHRGPFYAETGAIRDVMQNHLLQVMALLGMEPPVSGTADDIHAAKVAFLEAVRPVDPELVVRGQYTAGRVDGQDVVGFTDEPGVPGDSTTETMGAMALFVDNDRWSGVPFLIRAGKRMPRRETVVEVIFKESPLAALGLDDPDGLQRNRLVMRLQPSEGLSVHFVAKLPGPGQVVAPARMDFAFSSLGVSAAEAYERLLHDALLGDHTLFPRQDEVARSWQIVQPVLDHPTPVYPYPAGAWGPAQARQLAGRVDWHQAPGD